MHRGGGVWWATTGGGMTPSIAKTPREKIGAGRFRTLLALEVLGPRTHWALAEKRRFSEASKHGVKPERKKTVTNNGTDEPRP